MDEHFHFFSEEVTGSIPVFNAIPFSGKSFFDILDRKYKLEVKYKESKQGRMEDALALRGDEGRDNLR